MHMIIEDQIVRCEPLQQDCVESMPTILEIASPPASLHACCMEAFVRRVAADAAVHAAVLVLSGVPPAQQRVLTPVAPVHACTFCVEH